MSSWKRLLSVLIAAFMLLAMPLTTGIARAYAESTNEQTETEDPSEQPTEPIMLETEPLDPSTLHVKKLGEIDEAETPAEEERTYDPDEIVRVSIFLDGKSTIDQGFDTRGIAENRKAIAYRSELRSKQDALQTSIERAVGHKLTVKWNLTLLVNAISVEIPFRDIVKIRRMRGVKSVEFETQYLPPDDMPADDSSEQTRTINTSKNMVGASTAWNLGYRGAGSRVAIVDTGLDTTHVMFSKTPFEYAINQTGSSGELFTQAQLNALKSQLNSNSANYLSSKVPYAYDYACVDTDVTHVSDGSIGSNHGSHVAGIAAGNRYTNGSGTQNTSAVGMAPDAQLFIMKVFGEDGLAYDSDTFAAIEDALVLECDTCNLSLGYGNPGFSYANTYQTVLNRLADQSENEGMVVSISAGNSYAMTTNMSSPFGSNGLYLEDVSLHTGGAPGTFINSLCVASADNVGSNGNRSSASISNFSSWGIPGSLLMKPEITAPGGSIVSAQGKTSSSTSSNQYTTKSGTSMAAPHIAGLSALAAEYLRENPISQRNAELSGNYSTRAIIQSLLMSTATPMKSSGSYLSILRQGAGLAEVGKAVQASSVIMMQNAHLTTKTGAAADGKVKVELGDDPDKTGSYTYSFKIYNISDADLTYTFSTDLFTQGIKTSGSVKYMAQTTTTLGSTATYTMQTSGASEGHDVDMDGDTDDDDAQAILDYLTGEKTAAQVDLSVADLDGDNAVTSQDAHLLLNWQPAAQNTYTVPAGETRLVTVTVTLTSAAKTQLANYPNGAYIEGFTYVTCSTSGHAHEHTIPILGFYGSWTEPSMFDTTSYVDTVYGTGRSTYSGNTDTNYMTMTVNGKTLKFSGNPYKTESSFPSARLAISSRTMINGFAYNLIRSAGTTGFAVSELDGIGGNVVANGVKSVSVDKTNLDGIWYYVNGSTWYNKETRSYTANTAISGLGVQDGDVLRIGYYAVPEYNAIQINTDVTDAAAGQLTNAKFAELLESNRLGSGAFVGYDFTVDNVAPTIETPTLSGSNLTIGAADNHNLAYVAVLSLDGVTKYAEWTPASPSFSQTANISTAVNNANGYVAVFAGDYAGNESAVAVKVNNNSSVDPNAVTSVSLTPTTVNLYCGHTQQLTASILPITASQTVTWMSSNPSAATVEDGVVTAVGTGTATITATSTSDPTKTATCTVNALRIDKTLYGIIWDEDGNEFFRSFNVDTLPETTKLHQDDKQLGLHSAVMMNDTLYASTLNSGSSSGSYTSTLYRIDRNTYQVTEIGSFYSSSSWGSTTTYWASDMAPAPNNRFVYACAKYIRAVSLSSPNSQGTGKTVSNYNLVGVAAKSLGSSTAEYYCLDTAGDVYTISITSSSSSSVTFGTAQKLLSTGITSADHYQTLYYDGSYLYWGHWDEGFVELIIIDPSNGAVYHAGDFGSNYTATGFYLDGQTAPASIDDADVPLEEPVPLEPKSEDCGAPAGPTDPEETLPVQPADPETETVESADPDAGAGAHRGHILNRIGGTANSGTVTLSESAATLNGLFTMTYDPTELTYQSHTTNTPFISVHPDSSGVITIAYAVKGETPIAAGTTLATVTFATQVCGSAEIAIVTTQRSNSLNLSESASVSINGLGHDWGAPTYAWANVNGNWTCTATRVCQRDGSHTETETVTASRSVSGSNAVYTASFGNSAFAQQVKTVEIAYYLTGSMCSWGVDETYRFTANPSDANEYILTAVLNEGAIVKVIRAEAEGAAILDWYPASTWEYDHNDDHNYTVDYAHSGNVNVYFRPDPSTNDYSWTGFHYGGYFFISKLHTVTIVTDGNGTASIDPASPDYTAAVDFAAVPNAGYHYDRVVFYQKTGTGDNDITDISYADIGWDETNKSFIMPDYDVVIKVYFEAHVFGDPTYVWAADNSAVTASRICTVCGEEETETVNASYAVTTPASCTGSGIGTYTSAAFANPAFTVQTKEVTIPATGHTLTHHDSASASCTEDGNTEYWSCSVCGKFFSDANGTTEIAENSWVIPATGHNWGAPSYVWATDNSAVTATRVCANDASHTETETVTTSYTVTTPASCTGNGVRTYTSAAFANPAFTVQTKEVTIPATGHTLTHHDSASATCTEDGNTEYWSCSVCGKYFSDADGTDEIAENSWVIPATGHDWGDPTYVWAADNSAVTASRVCANDASHTETETVTTSYTVTTPASCTGNGVRTYTSAAFANAAFTVQTKEVTIPATGHTLTHHDSASASCTEDGNTEYWSCSVCGKFFSDANGTTEIAENSWVIPATGHDWGDPTYVWAADNSAVTATRVCANDASHTETETVTTSYAVTTAPTVSAEGEGLYTATFTNPAFMTQTQTVVIPKLTQMFTVAYVDYLHGTVLQISTVASGSATPAYTGAFPTADGWRVDPSDPWTVEPAPTVTKDIVYILKWIKTFKVTFDADGGTVTPAIDPNPVIVDEGEKVIRPADPQKEGYTFTGWYEYSAPFDFDTAIERDVELTAKWQINVYNVTVDPNNGEDTRKIPVEHGATLMPPEQPVRNGFTFAGWYCGDTVFDFDTPITAPMTLTAHWNEIPVKIETRIDFTEGAVAYKGTTPYVMWDGTAKTPGFTVMGADGQTLTPDTDFTVAYLENDKPGTGYIRVTVTNPAYGNPADRWFKIYLPASEWLTVENVDGGILLNWAPVEGAAGYVIYRRAWSTTTDGWTAFDRWYNVSGTTTWTDGSDASHKVYAGTRYQYGVKAYFERRQDTVSGTWIGGNVNDDSGNYNLGFVSPLKTTVRITSRVLTSVTPDVGKLTVGWNGSKVFDGYEIAYSINGAFPEDNTTIVRISEKTTCQTVIENLTGDTTYYVRVRSYHVFEGTTYFGAWSESKSAAVR